MKKLLFFSVLICSQVMGMDKTAFFKNAGVFLSAYVQDGTVDYKKIKEDPEILNQLVNNIAHTNLQSYTAMEQKAFYINAYNIIVIKSIVDHYPVKSPMNIDGFFNEMRYKVGGEMLTLDEIEREKLLKTTKDERLHFALVCAAKGCPKLRNEAYIPEKLSEQLKQQTLVTLNDENFISVYEKNKKVLVSQIFKWYLKDFADDKQELIKYINRFRKNKIDPSFEVDFYDYGWTLNERR